MSAATRSLTMNYFSLLREQRGLSEERLLTTALTARELYDELAKKYQFTLPSSKIGVAINSQFCSLDQSLQDGDGLPSYRPSREDRMAVFELTDSVIDPKELKARMLTQEAGAFASFEGWVRNHNDGRDVLSLDYEVFEPLALSEGATIIAETMTRFDLIAARAIHRHGSLSLGDCAVWVGVTARHRGDAFDACRSIIDEIKHRLPIWKKEHYAEGPSQCVNCSHPSANRGPASLAVDLRSYYDRQKRLPEVGAQGQEKFGRAKVLIVGLGGLGSSASLALAAAGVGTLGLLESDSLAATNLHRQILYSARDLGRAKVELAEQRLSSQNPLIKIVKHAVRLSAANAENIIRPYDLILDCTDNFQTKYLLNDAAIILGKRLIQASIYRFEGHLLTIGPTSEGCLRCLWPTPPAAGAVGDCGEVGTLGTIPMVLGTLQANEAIKSVLELAVPSESNLITFDLQSLTTTHLRRQHHAKVCCLR